MTTHLILAHSPLLGPSTWEPVAAELARAGYRVSVPDLSGTVAAGPPYGRPQAEIIARSEDGDPPVLVAHSAAGSLLATAGMMIGQVRAYIFVDARLPTPGRSWAQSVSPEHAARRRELADSRGWLPPWPQWWHADLLAGLLPDRAAREAFTADCPDLPLAMFEEAQPPAPQWPDAPGAYLRLSESYEDYAASARELGWPVITLARHHLALLTDPSLVAGSLGELISQLGAGPDAVREARAGQMGRAQRPAGGAHRRLHRSQPGTP